MSCSGGVKLGLDLLLGSNFFYICDVYNTFATVVCLVMIFLFIIGPTGIYRFADAHSLVQLRDAAEIFILEHFRGIVKSDEFLQLPLDVLLRFLRSDELHIEAEYEVLDAILGWLDSDAACRRRLVYDVMDTVRVTLIPLSFCERSIAACKDLGTRIAVQKLVRNVHRSARVRNVHRSALLQITVQPRRHARKTVYVVGGYRRDVGARWSDSVTLSRVDGFEMYLRVWRSVPALSSSRSGVAVAMLNNAVYAVGGESDSMISDSVERFDPAVSSRWQTVESLILPRCSAGACAVNDRLYVFGGWIGSEIGKSFEFYEPQRKMWTVVDPFDSKPRYAMGVIEYNGKVCLISCEYFSKIFVYLACLDRKICKELQDFYNCNFLLEKRADIKPVWMRRRT